MTSGLFQRVVPKQEQSEALLPLVAMLEITRLISVAGLSSKEPLCYSRYLLEHAYSPNVAGAPQAPWIGHKRRRRTRGKMIQPVKSCFTTFVQEELGIILQTNRRFSDILDTMSLDHY